MASCCDATLSIAADELNCINMEEEVVSSYECVISALARTRATMENCFVVESCIGIGFESILTGLEVISAVQT